MNKLSRTMIKPVNALWTGARLQEYEIRSIIGEGGFGIVYLAFDTHLERDVAIKEYLPVSHASRAEDGVVRANSTRKLEAFDKGLRSFVSEARMLARFKHPALVEVLRFWEENGTAYMVMPYYRGQTLSQLIQGGRRLRDENELRAFLLPLLKGLSLLHAADCYHRDISSDNILMLEGNGPLLLDFGAARSMLMNGSDLATVILKPGFAPIEQYSEDTSLAPQGPWTDLYALCAVAYQAITGSMPIVSVARIIRDPLEPLTKLAPPGFSRFVLAALDKGLRVHPGERLQSVEEFESLLAARTSGVLTPAEHSAAAAAPAPGTVLRAPAVEPPAAVQPRVAPAPASVPEVWSEAARAQLPPLPPVPDPAPRQDGAQVAAAPAVPPLARLPRPARWQAFAAAVLVGGAALAGVLGPGDGAGEASRPPVQTPDSMPYSLPPPGAAGTESGPNEAVAGGSARAGDSAAAGGMAEATLPELADAPSTGQALPPEPPVAVAGDPPPATPVPPEAPASGAAETTGVVPLPAPPPIVPDPALVLDQARAPGEGPAEARGAQRAAAPPRKAMVDVRVAPWGKVFVNGSLAGVAPPSLRLPAEPGAMHIEIRNETHPPKHFLIDIEADHVYRISHVFGAE